MGNEFIIINIRRYLQQGEEGEKLLKQVFSTFSCKKNADVDRFLLQQSIDFTKKNQSVTYIVVSSEHNQIVGYFTITIKPITVNVDRFSNTTKRKIARVSEQNIENYSIWRVVWLFFLNQKIMINYCIFMNVKMDLKDSM